MTAMLHMLLHKPHILLHIDMIKGRSKDGTWTWHANTVWVARVLTLCVEAAREERNARREERPGRRALRRLGHGQQRHEQQPHRVELLIGHCP